MSTKKIRGYLFAWGETGTEGLSWAIQDLDHVDANGMYNYEGLHVIHNQDHLKIYKQDGNTLVWEYSHDRDPDEPLIFGGVGVHWIPDNVDLVLWYQIFKDRDEPYIGELTTYVSEED